MFRNLFNDRLILSLDTPDLAQCISLSMDMRVCTRTIIFGPVFFIANGATGLRCFYELGSTQLVLDASIHGDKTTMQYCVDSAVAHGLAALTVSPWSTKQEMREAVVAVDNAQARDASGDRLKLLVNIPDCRNADDRMKTLGSKMKYVNHAYRVIKMAQSVGIDGAIMPFYCYYKLVNERFQEEDFDMREGFSMAARTTTGPHNYLERPRTNRATITRVLKNGADHAVLSSRELINTDFEWSSEMARKELDRLKPSNDPVKVALAALDE